MLIRNQNYAWRSRRPSIIGGASSSWAATTEFNFGKDLMYDFLGCANLLWSKHWPDQREFYQIVQNLMPEVRRNLSGKIIPSEDGNSVVPIKIAPYFNTTFGKKVFGVDLSNLKIGRVSIGKKMFKLADPCQYDGKCALVVGTQRDEENALPHTAKGIEIEEDVSSIIFLHACARQAINDKSFRIVYNFADTADLLGYYEVIYEDALLDIVPIRYGVNILEWNVVSNPGVVIIGGEGKIFRYCYGADMVICSKEQKNPTVFFAYEWVNPRFGKKIKKIRLVGSNKFKNAQNKVISNNAVILIALSVVKKRAS